MSSPSNTSRNGGRSTGAPPEPVALPAAEPDQSDAGRGLATLARGLSILDALAGSASRGGVSQAALARQLGFQRSTIYRYLACLQDMGFVEATEDAKYRLGPRVVVLAAASMRDRGFPRYTRRFVNELAELTGETAHATIFDGGQSVTIELADGTGPIGPRIQIGARRAPHCSASGKLYLAFTDPRVLDDYASRRLEVRTARTITDYAELRAELAEVRARGYATDRSEYIEGISCMAVPVFDSRRDLVGAFSVSVAADDLDEALIAKLGPPLRRTAQACSRLLGMPDDD